MAGGVSGAASGGILGLVLVLIAQQFGYIDFSSLEQTLILIILVILVFAVVFGIAGRIMKAAAVRRAKSQAHPSEDPNPESGTPPPPPAAPGTPPA
ncbi:MAG: hypothetical protein L3K02_08540 [Thermoplasmata archaeon]|nr:hypothetical protein [Thermoplasmata archaeon]